MNDVEGLKHIRDGLLKNGTVLNLSIGYTNNQDRKYLQIRSQIDAELKNRARAHGKRVTAADTVSTANSATTTTQTKGISGKDPG